MSNLNFNSSKNDYNIDKNNNILNNLNQIYHKFVLINNSFNNDDCDEYEEFFNRVNFYFSNIIMQLKLKYIESLKELEKKNSKNEKDILDLIMENMILKIENQSLEEKNLFNSINIINNPFQKNEIKIIDQKDKKVKKRKKSRNKQSKYFSEEKDESFKYEIKTYLNSKMKKKMNLNNNISNSFNIINANSNYSNLSVGNIKKKNNLKNFITHSNLIKRNSLNKNIRRNNIKRHYQSNSTLNTFFSPKIYLNNMTTDKIIKERNLYTIPTRLKNSFYDFDNISIKIYKSSYSKNKNNKNIKQKNVFNLLSKNKNGNKSLKNISNKINLSVIKKSEYPIYQKMKIKKLNKIHHSNMKELINLKIKKNK